MSFPQPPLGETLSEVDLRLAWSISQPLYFSLSKRYKYNFKKMRRSWASEPKKKKQYLVVGIAMRIEMHQWERPRYAWPFNPHRLTNTKKRAFDTSRSLINSWNLNVSGYKSWNNRIYFEFVYHYNHGE